MYGIYCTRNTRALCARGLRYNKLMPCIPSARDITCLHPKGILTIATVAFVARALQTLALHSDSLPSNTHLGTKSFKLYGKLER